MQSKRLAASVYFMMFGVSCVMVGFSLVGIISIV